MNNIFFTEHCMDHWRHAMGCRGARKVRGFIPTEGLYMNRDDVIGFSIEADGIHVFLLKNAEKLGYTRDYTSGFKNKYDRNEPMEDLKTAREIIGLFFKHCPRVELVTYMGESNVIKAEQFMAMK